MATALGGILVPSLYSTFLDQSSLLYLCLIPVLRDIYLLVSLISILSQARLRAGSSLGSSRGVNEESRIRLNNAIKDETYVGNTVMPFHYKTSLKTITERVILGL